MKIVHNISVNLNGHYGSDELIANRTLITTKKRLVNPENTIKFILKHKHLKPFEHGMLDFELKIPIFLDRQVVTYRTMVGSLGESGRYVSPEDMAYYLPKEEYEGMLLLDRMDINDTMDKVQKLYNRIYKPGNMRSREVARNLLPQSLMTVRIFQINLRNFMHFLDERLEKSAQTEMRELANRMLELALPIFPISLNGYVNKGE